MESEERWRILPGPHHLLKNPARFASEAPAPFSDDNNCPRTNTDTYTKAPYGQKCLFQIRGTNRFPISPNQPRCFSATVARSPSVRSRWSLFHLLSVPIPELSNLLPLLLRTGSFRHQPGIAAVAKPACRSTRAFRRWPPSELCQEESPQGSNHRYSASCLPANR